MSQRESRSESLVAIEKSAVLRLSQSVSMSVSNNVRSSCLYGWAGPEGRASSSLQSTVSEDIKRNNFF